MLYVNRLPCLILVAISFCVFQKLFDGDNDNDVIVGGTSLEQDIVDDDGDEFGLVTSTVLSTEC